MQVRAPYNTNDFCYLQNCCLCDSMHLEEVISLNPTPPANELVKSHIPQQKFPLDIMQCQNCGHHQLSGEVNPNRVFDNYVYVAGTSKINREHYQNYVNHLIKQCNLCSDSFVFEIGSNDGLMLSYFKEITNNILGIDPAKNIVEQANKNGTPTINNFFSKEQATKILAKYGKADLIVANNVLAHTSQLQDIVDGINILLSDEGILVFEVSYFLDVLNNTLFDLIYNEHIHQHLIGPLFSFFDKNNLSLYDVEHLPNHGGSIRVYVSKKYRPITLKTVQMLRKEDNIIKKIMTFNKNINDLEYKLKEKLNKIKKENKTIAAFGYAAKATTFLHQFNINNKYIDFIVDSNELKQNLLSPGFNIPIYHPDEIYKRNPDYILILGWNFADSIIKNHVDFKGKWIVPLPELKEI